MPLSDYTTEELEAELEKRNTPAPPEKIEAPDWSRVITLCEEHLEDPDERDDDMREYIYEEAMKAVYGKDVFDYINEIRD